MNPTLVPGILVRVDLLINMENERGGEREKQNPWFSGTFGLIEVGDTSLLTEVA